MSEFNAEPPRRLATAIHTDTAHLQVQEVSIPSARGDLPAYRARFDAPGWQPLVLVLDDAGRTWEHARDVARRFAKFGHDAIAIDSTRAGGCADEDRMADLDATVAWAQAHGGDASRLSITGFGAGGRLTWLYAAHQPRLKAAIAWYGALEGETTPAHPRHPIDVVHALRCPVLGLYGAQDVHIPSASVERMRAALRRAGSASQVLMIPDAPHGFFADDAPSYRREAADEGWLRLQAWLRTYGA